MELITDYLEDRLSPADRALFDAHLAACPPCIEYVTQVRAVVSAAGRIDPEDLPDDVRDGLTHAFRGWLAGR